MAITQECCEQKLNKSWWQHPTRHQLYGHLPPITKTIQVRQTRHAGHCWRSRDKLISDVLLWTPAYGRTKPGRPARTYIQQLCEDTGCSPEDLPKAMNNREKWRERVRDIHATSTTWWWWWWVLYRGHPLFFLECIYLHLLYPLWYLICFCHCVCVCACASVSVCVGVVLGLTNCHFSSLCMSVCLGDFFCVCVAVWF